MGGLMPRSKYGVPSHRKRRKILKQAKGYWGRRHSALRTAREAVERALQFAYRDRRQKKREFRALWITRINAAARANGVSYSALVHGLQKNNVAINRKILADIAVRDPQAFQQIVEIAKS